MEEWQENQCRASKHQARGGMTQGEQRNQAEPRPAPSTNQVRMCSANAGQPEPCLDPTHDPAGLPAARPETARPGTAGTSEPINALGFSSSIPWYEG